MITNCNKVVNPPGAGGTRRSGRGLPSGRRPRVLRGALSGQRGSERSGFLGSVSGDSASAQAA